VHAALCDRARIPPKRLPHHDRRVVDSSDESMPSAVGGCFNGLTGAKANLKDSISCL
jgi:hypothetical protein